MQSGLLEEGNYYVYRDTAVVTLTRGEKGIIAEVDFL